MRKDRGQLSIEVLIFGMVAVFLLAGFTLWTDVNVRAVNRTYYKTVAFEVSEAGIEYYRWHLAHDPDDYQDGTGQPGPYVHPYYDKEGVQIGSFSLDITPPGVGSTIVTIRSTGSVIADPTVEKIIEVRMGLPSFAKYASVANADIRYGAGTEVSGLIHSNGGIRFDGLAHNVVSSAKEYYDDPDHSGADEWAVHTHVSPTDPTWPTPMPLRTDVFAAGREVSIPAVDFAGITQDLADMKTNAQGPDGFYQGPSNDDGYEVILKVDDTFDLYKVTSLESPPSGCYNYLGQSGWGTWSIRNKQFINNYTFPANGVIFIEDDVWVQGQIDGARITIAAGRFPDNPTTNASITFNHNIRYTNYDGTDVIALIAQKNINAGWKSDDIITIDAALVAQNGRVGRYYYRKPWWWYNRCAPYHERDTISLYGMIATNQRYGFAYTDNTGYDIRNINYDSNLLYGPPPDFPITAGDYEMLSWEEVK